MILDNFAIILKRYTSALFGEAKTKKASKSLMIFFLQTFIINLTCMWGTMMGGIKFIISAQVDHAVKEEAGWRAIMQLQILVDVQKTDAYQNRQQRVTCLYNREGFTLLLQQRQSLQFHAFCVLGKPVLFLTGLDSYFLL